MRDTPGIVSVYLFGSLAVGRGHAGSDVDLGIVLDRRDWPTAASRVDLRLSLFPVLRAALKRDIDLVVLNDAPPEFARRVMMDGRRLLLRDEEADRSYRRVTLSRAADLQPFLRRTRAVKLRSLAS